MAFTRPTLSELVEQARTEIDVRLPGADSRLRRSMLDVLARIVALAAHGLHGFAAYIAEQLFADTAVSSFLSRRAAIYALQRLAATFAAGGMDFTGEDAAVIPAGARLRRADGQEYSVDAEVIFSGTAANVAVTAVAAGSTGNAAAATELTLVSPLAGVNATALVDVSGLTGGTDEESDEPLRTRLLERIRQPPEGGAEHDYVRWCQEVPGVTRAWVVGGLLGLGTVAIYFVRDDDVSIIPDAAEVQAVQDYIDDPTRRPLTADAIVAAPTPVPVNYDIRLTPNTTELQAAVQAALEDLHRREATLGGTLLITHIAEAISGVMGEQDHQLIAPAADVTAQPTELLLPGTFTWA